MYLCTLRVSLSNYGIYRNKNNSFQTDKQIYSCRVVKNKLFSAFHMHHKLQQIFRFVQKNKYRIRMRYTRYTVNKMRSQIFLQAVIQTKQEKKMISTCRRRLNM